ncbi:MAG: DUF1905 domain-containing protein [Usitatibacter sp.]
MAKARFRGVILEGHKQAAIETPFDPAVRFNTEAVSIRRGRNGVPVRAVIAGITFETYVVARQKRFWLIVEDEHLDAAGVAVGDEVAVSLEPR